MKILSRRNPPARNPDVNGDGVVDARDEHTAAARTATGRPSSTSGQHVDPDPAPERTVDLNGDGRPDQPVDLDRDGRPDRELDPVLTKKPRASLLATLGLIVSVAGALFVLTGALAGHGIGLGAVGAVLSVLGLMATRRRHIAGKTDALIGVAAGVAAVVLGIVAMTGQFDWPTTDGQWVGRFREWLDSQFANWF